MSCDIRAKKCLESGIVAKAVLLGLLFLLLSKCWFCEDKKIKGKSSKNSKENDFYFCFLEEGGTSGNELIITEGMHGSRNWCSPSKKSSGFFFRITHPFLRAAHAAYCVRRGYRVGYELELK